MNRSEDAFQGNLASRGLETLAARKKLAAQFNMQNSDYSIGVRKVNNVWVRVDGSAINPPMELVWYPCCNYGNRNDNYMRVRSHPTSGPENIGTLWDYYEEEPREFVCEN